MSRLKNHIKEAHQRKCRINDCSESFSDYDQHVSHVLDKHMSGYDFVYLSQPNDCKDWLKDQDPIVKFDDAYNLLRLKFVKANTNEYIREQILKNV